MRDYNGWSNRETWLVALNFDFTTRADLASIREMLEDEFYQLPTFWQDFVSLHQIDWDELESHCEDEDEDEEEPEPEPDPVGPSPNIIFEFLRQSK
jgi:hypothetical protein